MREHRTDGLSMYATHRHSGDRARSRRRGDRVADKWPRMSSGGLSEHLSSPLSGQSTRDVLVLSFSVFRPKAIIFSQRQIAQFDCSVCTSEEADEART